MSYYLDQSDQARFGLAEPDEEDHGEEQTEHSDFCPHCYAERQGAESQRHCPIH